jgi:uncharacterized protein YjbI with pentapeptide repeats
MKSERRGSDCSSARRMHGRILQRHTLTTLAREGRHAAGAGVVTEAIMDQRTLNLSILGSTARSNPCGPGLKPHPRLANTAVAMLLVAIGAMNAMAADLSVDQVKAALRSASPSMPADFAGKDLSNLDLTGLDFRKANLRGVNLFGSKLVQSDFRDATLEGANLNGAWLMGTDFTGANLSRASLLSVVVLGGEVKKMPSFKSANMTGIKMIADLPGADLSGADLSRAMAGVNIKNQGMGQMRTDLSGANLGGTIFKGVKGFAEAKGLDRAENLDKIVR